MTKAHILRDVETNYTSHTLVILPIECYLRAHMLHKKVKETPSCCIKRTYMLRETVITILQWQEIQTEHIFLDIPRIQINKYKVKLYKLLAAHNLLIQIQLLKMLGLLNRSLLIRNLN